MRIDDIAIHGSTITSIVTDNHVVIRKFNVMEESSLPTTNNNIGDRVRYNDSEYVWNGNAWVEVDPF